MRTNKKLFKESEKVKQRYATRKLKVGMVSLLMGFTFIFGLGAVAQKADLFTGAVQASAVEPLPTINTEQEKYIGYISKGWWPFYSTGIVQDKSIVNRLVKVERMPVSEAETSEGIQSWKITYNQSGVLGQIGVERNIQPIYPANPRFSFSLTKDAVIEGNVKYTMYSENGNVMNSLEVAPKTSIDKTFLTSGNSNDSENLRDLTYKGPNDFSNYITSRGEPSPEFQWMQNEGGQAGSNYVNYLKSNEDQIYSFVYSTWGTHKKKFTVEFKTKSNKIIKDVDVKPGVYSQELIDTLNDESNYAGVTGSYSAFDNQWTTYEFSQTSLKNMLPDTDGDGLPDAFEKYISSDPKNVNTDGDSRNDGVEVESMTPEKFTDIKGLWKIKGTDPTVAPPIAPGKILARKGEVINGKARPHMTIAIRIYPNGSTNYVGWQPLAETLSDAEGNYKLVIGKIFERSNSVNKYGNNITFKDINKLEPSYVDISTTPTGNYEYDNAINALYNKNTGVYGGTGYEAKVEEWSDGFDGRPLFSKPEIAIPSKIVPTIQDKYNNFKPDVSEKTPVANPDHLTPEEKEEIKNKIWDSINKEDPKTHEKENQQLVNDIKGEKDGIKVDDKGNVTIDIDGTDQNGNPVHFDIPAKDVISQESAPIEANQEGNNIVGTTKAPKGTPVKLENEDGSPVKDSTGKPLVGTVGDNGTVTIPIPEDKRGELNGKNVKLELQEPNKAPSVSNNVKVSFESAAATDVHQNGNTLTAKTKAPAGTVVKLQDSDGNYIKDSSGKDIEATVTEGVGGENNISFNLTPDQMSKVGGKDVKLSVEETGKTPNNDGHIHVMFPPEIYKAPKEGDQEVQVLLPKEAQKGETLKVTVGDQTASYTVEGPVDPNTPVTVKFKKPFDTSKDNPTKVTAVMEDGNGNTSSTNMTTVRNVEMSSQIQNVEQVKNDKNGNAVITGRLPKDVTGKVSVTVNVDGKDKTITTTEPLMDDNRTVRVEIPKEYNGKEVTFHFQEQGKNGDNTIYTPSSSEPIKIDLTAPSAPSPVQPMSGDESITVIPSRETEGNPDTVAKEGDVITVKDSDGKILGEKTLTAREADEAKDNMTVSIPLNRALKPGEKLEITETDKYGNVSKASETTVKSDAEAAGELKSPDKTKVDNINSLTPDEKKAVAKAVYEANKDKNIAEVNGEPQITVDEHGNVTKITFKDGSTLQPKEGEPAIEHLAQKDTVSEKTVSAPIKDVKQVYENNEDKITGHVDPNADGTYPQGTVTVTDENGVPIDAETGKPDINTKTPLTGKVGADGKISIILPEGVKVGQKVKLTFQEDGKDKPSESAPITIDKEAPEAPFIKQPTAGEDKITISLGKDTLPGDVVKVTVTPKNGGEPQTFSYTVKDGEKVGTEVTIDVKEKIPAGLSEGSTIKAVTSDKYDNTSEPRTAVVKGQPPEVAQSYQGDDTIKIKLPEGAQPGNSVRVVVITTENGKNDYKIIDTVVPQGKQGGDVIDVNVSKSDFPNGLKEGSKVIASLNNGTYSTPEVVKGVPKVDPPIANDKVVNVKIPDYAQPGDSIKLAITTPDGPKEIRIEIKDGTEKGATVPVDISSDFPNGLQTGEKITAQIITDSGEEGKVSPEVSVKAMPAPEVAVPAQGDNKISVKLPQNIAKGDVVNVTINTPDGKTYTASVNVDAQKAGESIDVPVPEGLKDGLPANAKITAKVGEYGKTSSPVIVNGLPDVVTPTEGDKKIAVKLPNYAKAGDKVVITINPGENSKEIDFNVPAGYKGGDTVNVPVPQGDEIKTGDKITARVDQTDPEIQGKPSPEVTVKGIPSIETPSAGNTSVKVKLPEYVKPGDIVKVTVTDQEGKNPKVIDYKVPNNTQKGATVNVPVTDQLPKGLEEGSKVTAKIGDNGTPSPEVTVQGVPVVEVPTEGDTSVKVNLPKEIDAGGKLVITVKDKDGNTVVGTVEETNNITSGKTITVNMPKDKFPDGLKKDEKITAQIDNGDVQGNASEPVTVKAVPAPVVDIASSGDKSVHVILPKEIKPGDTVIVNITPKGKDNPIKIEYKIPDDANIAGQVEIPIEVPKDEFPNGLQAGDKIVAKIGEDGTNSAEVTVEGIPQIEKLVSGDKKVEVILPDYAKPGNTVKITVTDAKTKEEKVFTISIPEGVKGGSKIEVPVDKNQFPEGLNAGDRVKATIIVGHDARKPSATVTVGTIPAPTVEVPTAGDDKVTVDIPSEAQPGEKVYVTIKGKDGTVKTAEAEVPENNNGKVDVPLSKDDFPDGLQADDTITARVKDGLESEPVKVKGLPSVEVPVATDKNIKVTLPDYVKSGDKVNVTVTVPAKDGGTEKTVKIPYVVKSSEKGGDTVTVPIDTDFPNGLEAGSKVSANIDGDKNSQPVTVKEMPAPEVTVPSAGDNSIKLKLPEEVEPGESTKVIVTVTDKDGKKTEIPLNVDSVNKERTVDVPITKENLPNGLVEGDKVIAQVGENGKQSKPVDVLGVPSVEEPTANDSNVKVKLPDYVKPGDKVNVTVTVPAKDGQPEKTVKVPYEVSDKEKGGDTVSVPLPKLDFPGGLSAGDKVSAKIGENGKPSDETTVKEMPAPEITAPYAGSSSIDVKVPEKAEPGDTINVKVTDKDGKNPKVISYTVPNGTKGGETVKVPVTEDNLPGGLKAEDKITAQIGANGEVSNTVSVKAIPAPVVVSPIADAQKITVKLPNEVKPGDTVKVIVHEKGEKNPVIINYEVPKGTKGGDSVEVPVTRENLPNGLKVGDKITAKIGNNGDESEPVDVKAMPAPEVTAPEAGADKISVKLPKEAKSGDVVWVTVTGKDKKSVNISYEVPEGTKGGDTVEVPITPENLPNGLQAGDSIVAKVGRNGTLSAPVEVDKKAATEAAPLNPKVIVKDKDNLTDSEKEAVKKAVQEANPGAKDISVSDNGTVHFTDKDGNEKIISSQNAVAERPSITQPVSGDRDITVTIPKHAAPGDTIKITVTDKEGNNPKEINYTIPEGKNGGDSIKVPIEKEIPDGLQIGDKVTASIIPKDSKVPGPEATATTIANSQVAKPDEIKDGDKKIVIKLPDEAKPGDKIQITVTDKEGKNPKDIVYTIPEGTSGGSKVTVDIGKEFPNGVKTGDKVDIKVIGSNKSDTVTVNNKPSVGTVTINPITEGNPTATATVPKGVTDVKVTVNGEENPAYKVEVSPDGTVTITAPEGGFQKGDKIEVTASKDGCNPSSADTEVKEKPSVGTVTINPITEGDQTATATVPKGVTDVKVTVNGDENPAYKVEVSPDGTVTIKAPEGGFKKGDKIEVTASKDGYKPSSADIEVKEKPSVGTVTINPITEGDPTATAKVPEGATDVKVTVNGDENPAYKVEVSPDGTVTIKAPEGGFKKGDKIEVTASKDGNESKAETTVKPDHETGKIVINPITEGDSTATATVPEGATDVKVTVNGDENPAYKVEVSPDGTVTITAPDGGFKRDNIVKITANDGNETISADSRVKEKEQLGNVEVNPIAEGDSTATAKVPSGVTDVKVTINGREVPQQYINVSPDGTVTIKAPKEGFKKDERVKVTASKEGFNPSTGETVVKGINYGKPIIEQPDVGDKKVNVIVPDTIKPGDKIKVVITDEDGKNPKEIITAAPDNVKGGDVIPIEVPDALKGGEKVSVTIEHETASKTVTVVPKKDTGGNTGSGGSSGSGSSTPSVTTTRVAGPDRAATGAKVSKMAYPNGSKVVILANSEKFSDVLTAMPYGKTIHAPVLYTNFKDIPNETMNEIKRLGAEKVILIGGDKTISVLEQRALEGMGYKTDRVNGKDRYDTAKLIAERMKAAGAKGINNVVIASGEKFPDALSIAPLAVREETPILLAQKDTLSRYTIKGLEDLHVNKMYISGGKMSVSGIVEAKLKPYTKQAITRFAGHDRYETSVVITRSLMPNATKSVFASGEIFPDALLAGELVDYYNAPLMLLRKNDVPKSVENYVEKSSIRENIIVGGTNTISDRVVTELEDIERR